MQIDQTYASWASLKSLPPEVVGRMLQRAVRARESGVLCTLVSHQELDESQRRRVLASGLSDPGAMILSREPAGSVLLTEYLRGLSSRPDEANELLRVLIHGPQHREAVWASGSDQHRLTVVYSLRSASEADPSWSSWLAGYAGSLGRKKATALVRTLGSSCPGYAWEQVSSWGDPELLLHLHEHCARDFHGHGDSLIEWAGAQVHVMLEREERTQAAFAGLLLALMRYEKSERGTTRGSVILAALEAFHQGFRGDPELGLQLAMRIDQAHDSEPPSALEVSKALERGELPPRAVRIAALEPEGVIAEQVRTHPELTPADAARLLPAGAEEAALASSWAALCANRSRSWVVDLVEASWKDRAQFSYGHSQLSEVEREEVEARLIARRQANLHELYQRGNVSEVSLMRMSVTEWHRGRCSDALSVRVAEALASALGSDSCTWECFEQLSEEFEGSLGELVALALSANVLVEA